MRMGSERKQINLRADHELLAAIGELQRADQSAPIAPTMSDVIRRAVFEARDRLRQKTGRKK